MSSLTQELKEIFPGFSFLGSFANETRLLRARDSMTLGKIHESDECLVAAVVHLRVRLQDEAFIAVGLVARIFCKPRMSSLFCVFK